MKGYTSYMFLAAVLLLASALPAQCQQQYTTFSGQGMQWGTEVGAKFDYQLTTSENLTQMPGLKTVSVWGNVTYLPEIPTASSSLPTGTMNTYWPNATALGLSLPLLPIGNWSTVRSFFEYLNGIYVGMEVLISETPSTFSVMIGITGDVFASCNLHRLLQFPRTTNITLEFSKSDGAIAKYVETGLNPASQHAETLLFLVRMGYGEWLPSVPLAVGSIALAVELVAVLIIARRIISSRRNP